MINVNSEIGRLKMVLVHRPDDGISRVSPRRAEELLFDDIVYLPQMQEEHDIFTELLKALIGEENVLETEQLLFESLEVDDKAKHTMIDLIIDYEELPSFTRARLLSFSNAELAELLITGYDKAEDHILFDPIPNFIFTRDIAVAVNDHVIITKAAKEARFRENILTRFIFSNHPMFAQLRAEDKLINLNHIDEFPPSKKGETVSIEGGDMMMISDKHLLVGLSHRTNIEAIECLITHTFEKNQLDKISVIKIPDKRDYMHIDTVFTQVKKDMWVLFGPFSKMGYERPHRTNAS